MPFSPISTWLISTSSTRWGSAASVEWSWYGAPRPDYDKKLFGYFVWETGCPGWGHGRLFLHLCSLLCPLPTGAAQKRGEQNICHEDPEEATHRGHEAAGAHPLREAHHAGGALWLHRTVRSVFHSVVVNQMKIFFFLPPWSQLEGISFFYFYSQALQNIQGQKVPLHVDGSLFRWRAVDNSQRPVSC